MIADELRYRIYASFGQEPTQEQQQAMKVFAQFMTDHEEQSIMVMRGCAGTGKTTLASAIVHTLQSLQQRMVLMAPTGRAAKVFSLYAGHAAYTIHRRIYRQKSLEGGFDLNYNSARDTLFIVDEASMIGHDSLLDDLIRFVYNERGCRLMLIGDQAQLPPIGEQDSPALQSGVLQDYGLKVYECDLWQVLRQSQESGILYNATKIRDCVNALTLPIIDFSYPDIHAVSGDELIETLASSYSKVGLDETMVITRSNKRSNIYNQGIRNSILDREDELSVGDQLMVVKNNYYWLKVEGGELNGGLPYGQGVENSGTKDVSFIANGDRAIVRRVRNIHELYGFRFAEVTMTFPDYEDYELTATTLLDTLYTEAPALTHEQQEQLFNAVMEDHADIPLKQERIKKIKEDRYYNALQVKFAYAATCHKAQGGQWEHVYIDQGYMSADMLSVDYLHWLYTAFTRATGQLYLVNWPKTQTEEEDGKLRD